jgi:hypothetical protein
MTRTPRRTESRTMGEEIRTRAERSPHEGIGDATPVTGASRATTPPRPPRRRRRRPTETPPLPPGAR